MERSCCRRKGTRDGGNPGRRRPFLKTDGDEAYDNLDAGNLLGGWRLRRGHLDKVCVAMTCSVPAVRQFSSHNTSMVETISHLPFTSPRIAPSEMLNAGAA
ncbi:hypothetical protein [Rhizobium sp. 18065]|uniref:hypothetical protein n=1 Tax=Rhizobium sp. 18065 TaxID=2681411 RepID=UPI0013582A6F|nr:hypothetical protein [Rhizobium sp. 18065]